VFEGFIVELLQRRIYIRTAINTAQNTQKVEISLYDKENTFSDNKLDNSSNTLVETKPITSQEDQPIIQSHSARNIPKNPLFIPKSGSMNYPSAPKEPKKN
jgi:hypothetical protein